jgi:hypothetical protein
MPEMPPPIHRYLPFEAVLETDSDAMLKPWTKEEGLQHQVC